MNSPVLTPEKCRSLLGCQVILNNQLLYIGDVEHTTLTDGALFTFVDDENKVVQKLYEVELDFDDIHSISMFPTPEYNLICDLRTFLKEVVVCLPH